MTIEIRRIDDAELAAYLDAMARAFLSRHDTARVAEEVRPSWELDRAWAAVDDGRICGTFRSFATELTVPGLARVPGSAITTVTVLPSHRRRGLLRRMADAEHAALRERGEVLGLLYAAEYPIYGRFGYGPACQEATWTLDALAAGAIGGAGLDDSGTLELVSPADHAGYADDLEAVFETHRAGQPGEVRRRATEWAYDLGRETAWGETWKGFLVVHRDAAGTVDGYARYRVTDKWDERQPRNVLDLDELHGVTETTTAALWRYLAGIDWVSTIKAPRRAPTDPLPWLLANARAAVLGEVGDGLWVRLVDLPRALEARTYDQSCRIVLEIVDPDAEGGRLRIALDASPDGASARPTDSSPDLTIDRSALGAAYLGAVPLRHAALNRGWDETRSGAIDDATALFRTTLDPWCSTFF